MIYKTFNPLVGWTMRRYFKNIHVDGLEHIPKKTAVIFACNHPSSFMEPMLLASIQPRKLYYLVRGDIFKGKIIKWLLKQTHQIPIFRRRDGIANLKQNEKTFKICYKMLEDNGVLMIFPEGSTERIKHLRPLQRGIWRLAFGTLERHRDLDIVVIPVGVNFTNLDEIRSEAMISFGRPFPLNQYLEEYEMDKAGTMRKLSPILYEKMLPHIVHFAPGELEKEGNLLLDMVRNEYTGKKNGTYIHSGAQLKLERNTASNYSKLNPLQRENILKRAKEYLSGLPDGVDSDYVIMQDGKPGSVLRFLMLFLPGIVGLILGVIPYKLALSIQKKLVNNDPPFHAPIRYALFLLMVLFLTIITFVILFIKIGFYAVIILFSFYFISLGTRLWDEFRWLRAKWNLKRSGLDLQGLKEEHVAIMKALRNF